jgi:hypothetical protein
MGRTKKDIMIKGRTAEEAQAAVEKWFHENNYAIIENAQGTVKARWRTGVATAAKYFQVSFMQADGGITAHTEGWSSFLMAKEQEFSSSALMGGIPRREGWKMMEQLWSLLQGLANNKP